jgi:anti-anti-sigma factor
LDLTIDRGADGVSVAHPSGRLDLLSASQFKRSLVDAVSHGRHRIVVDMGEVTFLDSSGLGALIGVLKAARLAGGDVRIARAREQALLVLGVTALDRVLTPYGTVEDAVDAYG